MVAKVYELLTRCLAIDMIGKRSLTCHARDYLHVHMALASWHSLVVSHQREQKATSNVFAG